MSREHCVDMMDKPIQDSPPLLRQVKALALINGISLSAAIAAIAVVRAERVFGSGFMGCRTDDGSCLCTDSMFRRSSYALGDI